MLTEKDLNRCIDLLAELNVDASSNEKKKILEIGYILKQELDIITKWNTSIGKNREIAKIDVKKLLEDNTQLFNENAKLLDINLQLKSVIDTKIRETESKIMALNNKLSEFTHYLKET